jgi:hypothetical protein
MESEKNIKNLNENKVNNKGDNQLNNDNTKNYLNFKDKNNYMNPVKISDPENYAIKITNSEVQDIFSNKKLLTLNINTRFELSPRRDQMKSKEIPNLYIYDKKKNKNLIAPKVHIINEQEKLLIEKIDKKITENIRNRKEIEVLFNDPEINQFFPPDDQNDN